MDRSSRTRVGGAFGIALFLVPLSGAQAETPPQENCFNDEDCPGMFAPHCEIESGQCVPCVVDEHCEADFVCHQYSCIPQCSSDADCEAPESHCSDEGVCYECLEDMHCAGDESLCLIEPEVGECVECIVDEDCGEDEPWCKWNNSCVECLEHPDCPADQYCSAEGVCTPDICEPGTLSCSVGGVWVLECDESGGAASTVDECPNADCEAGVCGGPTGSEAGMRGEESGTSGGSGATAGTGDPGALEGRGCSCSSEGEGTPLGGLGLVVLALLGVRGGRRES